MIRRLLLILLLASPCWGAVAHVASNQGSCGTSSHTGNIAAICNANNTTSFTYTPSGTNNAVLFFLGCSGTATPSVVALSASGWTFTQIGAIVGSTGANGFGAAFRAYAPNTSAATITTTWTSTGNCAGFQNDLIDEFSGEDTSNFADATNSATATSTTSCNSVSVTPTVANDGLWAGCNDSQTAAAAGWTKGADDGASDIAVYKVLAGGSGVSQSPGFSVSTGTAYVVFMVAIKPPSTVGPNVGFKGKVGIVGKVGLK